MKTLAKEAGLVLWLSVIGFLGYSYATQGVTEHWPFLRWLAGAYLIFILAAPLLVLAYWRWIKGDRD